MIYHGDCLDVLPTLPAQSVDAVICDPPYGTTACKWDSVIPFEPMWRELKRIIKPRGAIVLFGSQPFTSALVMSNVEWFKYQWVWNKISKTDVMNAKNKPMRQHEDVVVFSPGTTANKSPRKMVYNPQGLRPATRSNPKNRNAAGYMGSARPSHPEHYIYQNSGYPGSVLTLTNAIRTDIQHPTQKPIALLEYLIRTYTNEGDTVLDFAAGSGTTCVAAINTGRRFIGIEKDEGYYAVARRRIEEAQAAMVQMEFVA